ncbi:organic cation transporter protein-like [Saccostrea echinata]|uniref:organic cation transporter protein-like n=1 Tax=Saccostrea echinata TaxID=191078 RepID=UPI002A816A58|nr:organic cation transporter protein-like [Saccostrea echinata]
MDVDNILRSLGKYGRYQVLQMTYNLLCVPIMTYCVVISVFVGKMPEFKCKISGENVTTYINETYASYNVTIHTRQCDFILETNTSGILTQETIPCQDGYEYFGQETIASEWNLVCGAESLSSMSTTVAVIGQMIGAAVFPTLADKYGRLLIFYTNFLALVLCYVIAAVVPWFSAYVILRLLIGVFAEGGCMISAILALEMFPAESRGFVIYVDSIVFTLAITSLSPLAYLLRNVSWRYTMLAAGILGSHSLATRWILQESLRWLVVNGRYKEAKQWIIRAARWNKMDPSRILARFDSELQSREQQMLVDENTDLEPEAYGEQTGTVRLDSDRKKENLSVLDIFRHKKILLISMIVCVVWFVNSMTYYGIFLTSGTMSGDVYLNFFLNGIVEIPGIFIFWFTINRYGRRKSGVMFHAIAGVSLILAAVIQFAGDTQVLEGLASAMIFVGKSMITGSFITIFLYTPEIYPTNLRALSIGIGATAGRIGSIVSSFAALFASYVPWGPGVVFGSLSVLVTILFQWLPETTGKELPNTLEEVMSFDVQKVKKRKTRMNSLSENT